MIKGIIENFPRNESDNQPVATLSSATVYLQDMGENTITTQVKTGDNISLNFSRPWELVFRGEKYIMPIHTPQASKGNAVLRPTLDLTFQHWAIYWLKQKFFFEYPSVKAGTVIPDKWIVPLRLSLPDFCNYLAKVCEYWYGDKISVDLKPDTYSDEKIGIDISYSNIWDVLIKLFESYSVRWYIGPRFDNNNSIVDGERYVIRINYPAPELTHIFEQGFDGGLLKIDRQVQDEEIKNVLLGRGGSKNLPYRYFKASDQQNISFAPDPDWVKELGDIPFSELRGATFRSYIQGWKAAHSSEYPGGIISAPTADKAYAPWAWQRGYTDKKFSPVDFVADEFTIGDNGYKVKPDSSIAKYGEHLGGLENNEDIYPTIQGTGMDVVIDVEQILEDNVEQAIDSDAQVRNLQGRRCTPTVPAGRAVTVTLPGESFKVPDGKYANLDFSARILSNDLNVVITNRKIIVNSEDSGAIVPASGIPGGNYYYTVSVTLLNNSNKTAYPTIGDEAPNLTIGSVDESLWHGTFDIWIKNIWDSSFGIDADGNPVRESAEQYADRIWGAILGDHAGGEAKVVFSSGMLSGSQDYEFTLVRGGVHYDTSRSYNGVSSHWRLTLAKSDADLESTGLYIPSTKRQGKPGDTFFFIGIDMPHKYVTEAEIRLDDWKSDQLKNKANIKPSWAVTTDRVRMSNTGNPDAIIDQLVPGAVITLFDKQLLAGSHQEKLYLQSLTLTFREPSDNDPALNPDVEFVLSDKYETVANPVAMLQGEVNTLSKQVGSISNIEKIVRLIGDTLYLRKDGFSDRSMSPTEFYSLLSSGNFRAGIVGGAGWGFFKDENGNWTLETDRINVRQDMSVNNLVINQITARGGMTVESAAGIEVTQVVDSDEGYVCYFDQKNGSVANLFAKDDVAYCNRFSADNKSLKFYKRRVVSVSFNSITLTKGYTEVLLPDGSKDTGVNGSGIPEVGDVIVHYGNYNDTARQYVIVRDVIGGGYERFIEGLDSVNASGTEYYFIGRQTGMYNDRPRFFIGDPQSFVEYINGKVKVKCEIDVLSTVGSQSLSEYIRDEAGIVASPSYVLDLTNEVIAIPASYDGKPLPEALPVTTTVRVFKGAGLDSGWVFAAVPNEDWVVRINSDGVATVYALSPTKQTFAIPIYAKKGDLILETTLSIYKVVPGTPGKAAVVYSILPSVDNITRNADKSLSATTLSCMKYKTTEDGLMQPTDEYFLYASVFTEGSSIAAKELIAGPGVSSGSVKIEESTTAVIFTYCSTSSISDVLDRERVPVISDASGLEIGGTNLLLNSDFLDGTTDWIDPWGAQFTTINESLNLDNRPSIQIAVSGQTADSWYLFSQTVSLNNAPLTRTEPFILSFFATTYESGSVAYVGMRFLDINGTQIETFMESLDGLLKVEEFQYFSLLKYAPVGTVTIQVRFQLVRNGKLVVNAPKLEQGNKATAWSLNPADGGYIRRALLQDTKLNSGLILTSLIKTGYTNALGDRITQSGINGIYDDTKPGGGISIWGGGDEQDVLEPPKEGKRTATMLFRHDGTGYASNNVIKFEKDRIRVGENVVMDKNGFVLLDESNGERLRISDTNVGTYESFQETSQDPLPNELSVSGAPITIIYGTDGFHMLGLNPLNASLGQLKAGYVINSTVLLSFDAKFTYPDLSTVIYRRPSLIVRIWKDGNEIMTEEQSIAPNQTGSYRVFVTTNYLIEEDGIYRYEIEVVGSTPTANTATMKTYASITCTGYVIKSYADQTLLCRNGMASAWAKSLFLINSNEVIMRHGAYALRLSDKGFQKVTDGSNNWKPANI